MSDQNKALLDRLEVITLGLDEDCGEPGCPDCKPWRPVWSLMKDLRTAIDKPPAQLTHAEGCWSLEQAEPVVQDWDLLAETQGALRDAWAILKKLKAVQDAARSLIESDPDSAADTEGEAFAAWCALVVAIDDADTLLCEFGESNAAM